MSYIPPSEELDVSWSGARVYPYPRAVVPGVWDKSITAIYPYGIRQDVVPKLPLVWRQQFIDPPGLPATLPAWRIQVTGTGQYTYPVSSRNASWATEDVYTSPAETLSVSWEAGVGKQDIVPAGINAGAFGTTSLQGRATIFAAGWQDSRFGTAELGLWRREVRIPGFHAGAVGSPLFSGNQVVRPHGWQDSKLSRPTITNWRQVVYFQGYDLSGLGQPKLKDRRTLTTSGGVHTAYGSPRIGLYTRYLSVQGIPATTLFGSHSLRTHMRLKVERITVYSHPDESVVAHTLPVETIVVYQR